MFTDCNHGYEETGFMFYFGRLFVNTLEAILPIKDVSVDGTMERISSPAGPRTHRDVCFICNILHCININGPQVLEPNLLDEIQ